MQYFFNCGICGHYHSVHFWGDCREDSQRFTEEQIEAIYGLEGTGWQEVDQEDAPSYEARDGA